MVLTRHKANQPAEVYLVGRRQTGTARSTSHNAPLISQLDLPAIESVHVRGRRRQQGAGLLAADRLASTRRRNIPCSS